MTSAAPDQPSPPRAAHSIHNAPVANAGQSQLLVAATDLNVSLTAELKSANAHEGGITLGAKNLYELIANAPGDEVLAWTHSPRR